MSNQVSLMLSFIFLMFFILFSGEVITYQQTSAMAMSYTKELAYYIQTTDDDINLKNLYAREDAKMFDTISLTGKVDDNGLLYFDLKTYVQYVGFSNKFGQDFESEITCHLVVYRKE